MQRLFCLLTSVVILILSCGREREALVFTYAPAKPGPRDSLSIRYRADLSGSSLQQAHSIFFRFTLLSGAGDLYSGDLPMRCRGDEWSVRFRPAELSGFDPALMVCGFVDSDDPEFFDNDGGQPWIIPFLRDGEFPPGYHYQLFRLAAGEILLPDVVRIPIDDALIEESLKAELVVNPGSLPARAASWTVRLLETQPGSEEYEAIRKPIADDLDSIFSGLLIENEPDTTAVFLLELYRMIGMSEKGDSVVVALEERLPDSRLAVLAEYEWARICTNTGSLRKAREFARRYPNAPETVKVWDLLVKASLYSDEMVDEAIAIIEGGKPVAPRIVYTLAMNLIRAMRIEEAEMLARRCMELWESETYPGPSPYSEREWKRFHKLDFADYSHALAYIVAKRENYEEAVEWAERADAALAGDDDLILLANLAEWQGLLGRTTDALRTYDRLGEQSAPDSVVMENWRRLYGLLGEHVESFDEHCQELAGRRAAHTMNRLERLAKDLPTPAASVRDLSGNEHTLSEFLGSVIVLDFWATWCGPCMASLPDINEVYLSFSDQSDVVFMAVNTMEPGTQEERRSSIQEMWEMLGLTLPVYLDAGMRDKTASESAARQFKVTGIPRTIIIGRSGRILFDQSGWGGGSGGEKLTAMINFALSRSS